MSLHNPDYGDEYNPSLIQGDEDLSGNQPQKASKGCTGPAPLVLIHDGGGTVFSYYFLGPLQRPVWGIANPRYATREPWAGGIPAMARVYAGMVRRVIGADNKRCGCGEVEVILGGWSLGGLLAMAVAHVLAAEDDTGVWAGVRAGAETETETETEAETETGSNRVKVRVLGIIMIDSACPSAAVAAMADSKMPILSHVLQWNDYTRQETREAVSWCYAEAGRMIQRWVLPRWSDDPLAWKALGEGQLYAGGTETGDGDGDGAAVVGAKALKRPAQGPLPPVILLRSSQWVPADDMDPGAGVSTVDVMRADRMLGWKQHRDDFVKKVVNIPGHHFSVFRDENLDTITEQLRSACSDVELMSQRRYND